jgi:hypothetical protein
MAMQLWGMMIDKAAAPSFLFSSPCWELFLIPEGKAGPMGQTGYLK